MTYSYQNGRMTSYDGESCVYDENGNPTTYRGKTLTWTRGRLLETYPSLASPNVTWTFTYNADGIRVGKSAPGTTTTYGVDGERIVYEKTNGQIKRYFYDESGIAGFEYSGQKYVFRKNLQGDVVGICSSSGALIGEYVYDAWGNLLEEPTNGVLLANPFRYRGYYYDSSIGLYYLNSRYYDSETGRFLNEDLVSYLEPETIGGINPYAYCLNDPVNYIDPTGHKAEWWQWLLLGATAVAAGVAIGIGLGVVLAPTTAAVSFSALAANLAIGAGSGFLAGATTSLLVNGDPMEAMKAGGIGSLIGFVGGAVSYTSGILGSMLGNAFGQGLASMTVRGMQVGKAFSSLGGSQMIGSVFSSVGSIAGAIGGSMFANHAANQLLGNRASTEEEFVGAVEGELQSKILEWIYRFVRWLV